MLSHVFPISRGVTQDIPNRGNIDASWQAPRFNKSPPTIFNTFNTHHKHTAPITDIRWTTGSPPWLHSMRLCVLCVTHMQDNSLPSFPQPPAAQWKYLKKKKWIWNTRKKRNSPDLLKYRQILVFSGSWERFSPACEAESCSFVISANASVNLSEQMTLEDSHDMHYHRAWR